MKKIRQTVSVLTALLTSSTIAVPLAFAQDARTRAASTPAESGIQNLGSLAIKGQKLSVVRDGNVLKFSDDTLIRLPEGARTLILGDKIYMYNSKAPATERFSVVDVEARTTAENNPPMIPLKNQFGENNPPMKPAGSRIKENNPPMAPLLNQSGENNPPLK